MLALAVYAPPSCNLNDHHDSPGQFPFGITNRRGGVFDHYSIAVTGCQNEALPSHRFSRREDPAQLAHLQRPVIFGSQHDSQQTVFRKQLANHTMLF